MNADSIKKVLEELPFPFVEEFLFAKRFYKKFRSDFALPNLSATIEYEGMGNAWGGAKSRHTSLLGFPVDCDKYTLTARIGYTCLRYTRHNTEAQIKEDIMNLANSLCEDAVFFNKPFCADCGLRILSPYRLIFKRGEAENPELVCLMCSYLIDNPSYVLDKKKLVWLKEHSK